MYWCFLAPVAGTERAEWHETKMAKSFSGGRYLQSCLPCEGACLLHRAWRAGSHVYSRFFEVLCMPCAIPHTWSTVHVRGLATSKNSLATPGQSCLRLMELCAL